MHHRAIQIAVIVGLTSSYASFSRGQIIDVKIVPETRLVDVKAEATTIPTTAPGMNNGLRDDSAQIVGDSVAIEKIRRDLVDFVARAPQLAPADAARQWLGLFDRAMRLNQPPVHNNRDSYYDRRTPRLFADVVVALPPPAAWNDLAQQVAARPTLAKSSVSESSLHILAALLVNDRKLATEQFKVLQVTMADGESPAPSIRSDNSLSPLAAFLGVNADDPEALLADLDRQISEARESDNYTPTIDVPDLVTLIGKEKATELLMRAIGSAGEVKVATGDDTRRLAQVLAFKSVDSLKVPQWSLVDVNTVALFEAMHKRFPKGRPGQKGVAAFLGLSGNSGEDDAYRLQTYHQAQFYYMLGLIANNRTADAITVARELAKLGDGYAQNIDALSVMTAQGHGPAVRKFLHDLLAEDPNLPYWENYLALSAQTDAAAESLQLVRQAAAKPNLSREEKDVIQNYLIRALLAADEVDEAVSLLQKSLKEPDPGPPKPTEDDATVRFNYYKQPLKGIHAMQLARVGAALKRPDLFEEGIAAAKAFINPQKTVDPSMYDNRYLRQQLASLLVDNDRLPEAIKLLEADVKDITTSSNSSYDARSALINLVEAYSLSGQHKKVLETLQKYGEWNAADLSDIYMETAFDGTPLGQIVALALASEGHKDEAKVIVEAVLDQKGGFDPAYELRVSLGGDDLIPKLDELYSRDAFEERPLIWKAYVLHQAHKDKEAEAAARAAIAIDPSDGEQGPGRRMRAYAILGDIAESGGRAEEAAQMRKIVAAIRISESADTVNTAGLTTRALKMYNDGLAQFADAYCIQSRLARQYMELGMTKLAAEHYRRAYELMPSSFGRMESHCFGCEGVFNGEYAQKLAEEVFTRMLAEMPQKPQVHYLMGYLRFEEQRYAEAADLFKQAVKLDPLYLNAWMHLAEAAEHIHLPASDRDAAALAALRLDPMQRHVSPPLDDVTDLAKLWDAVAAAHTHVPPRPQHLLAMPAGAKFAKEAAARHAADPSAYDSQFNNVPSSTGTSSAQALAAHHAIAPLIQAVDGY